MTDMNRNRVFAVGLTLVATTFFAVQYTSWDVVGAIDVIHTRDGSKLSGKPDNRLTISKLLSDLLHGLLSILNVINFKWGLESVVII